MALDAGEQVPFGVVEGGELGRVGPVRAGVGQAPHPSDESGDLRDRRVAARGPREAWRALSRLLLIAGAGIVAVGVVLAAGEGGVVDLSGELGGVGGIDQAEVVDAGGRLRRLRRDLRPGLGVGVAGDLERQRRPGVRSAETDAQEGQVERVEHELDLPAGETRVDLVTVAVQRHQRRFRHCPVLRPAERLGQVRLPGTG